jgi:hypothetical protein
MTNQSPQGIKTSCYNSLDVSYPSRNCQKDRELLPLDGFDKAQCFQRFPMSSWDIASKNGFWQIFCQENALKP